MHLAGGLAPSGTRVLSAESVAAMRTITHDMGTPNVPPVGLGWLLQPFGDTTVLTMSGASPGGVAVLAVVPALDLVFAAFGNDPRALALHNELLAALLPPDTLRLSPPEAPDLARYAGTYRSNQLRVDVSVVDGGLSEQVTYEPADETQERIFTGFVGGSFSAPPRRYVPAGRDLFAPAGMPVDAFSRQLLVSYHGGGAYRPSPRSTATCNGRPPGSARPAPG